MASKLPGYPLKQGRHDVLYQAADEDGNKARCVFTVHVLAENQMPTIQHFRPYIASFYIYNVTIFFL